MLQLALRRRGSSIQRLAAGARVVLIAGAADRLMEVVAEAVGRDHEEYPVLFAVPLVHAPVGAVDRIDSLITLPFPGPLPHEECYPTL